MKEFIFTNYNLKVNKFYNDYFYINEDKIKIIKSDISPKNIERLFMLSNELYYKKIPVNTFILNKDGKFFSIKNKKIIALIRINDLDNYINLNYIKKFELNNNLEYKDIIKEWEEEIDDLERKMITYDKEYIILQKTANYYIGMAENAIALMKENKKIDNNSIGIKVSTYKLDKEEINNPFNYFKINKMYNISNYLKNKILTNKIDYNEIDQILKEINNEADEIALFSFMLYPNYYFELANKKDEEKMIAIIKIIPIYEKILNYIKINLYRNEKIKLFVWLF